jgi:hypothetical protein
VKRILIGVVLAVGVASALGISAPSAGPSAVAIAPGVTVSGVRVGGLMSERARARLRAAFERPIVFRYGSKRWRATAKKLGSAAAVRDAVSNALRADRGEDVQLDVYVRPRLVRRYVAGLQKRFYRPAQNAQLVGLVGLRPSISEERSGVAVRRRAMERAIVEALRRNDRKPIRLRVRRLDPEVTRAGFGHVIVIRTRSNGLDLYQGETPVRSFGVATGTARYPTPLGLFSIVDMQRDPWWRPPDSDWAEGLEPVPPGPGNPLGTRWMGLNAPGVGIHGTPDAASIGYSASHGCIRMQIPEAEWLFTQVTWGTPVYIVSA